MGHSQVALVFLAVLLTPLSASAQGELAEEPASKSVPWYFTLHGEEVGHDLTRSLKALTAVRRLGGQGVRFDVHWYEIAPERGRWDERRLTFYTSMVSQARHLGLDPFVVLGGAPGWARDLYGEEPSSFWEEYEAYVSKVLAWIGDRTQRYQLWNEANHPVWGFVRSRDRWQLFARAGRLVKRDDPGSETVVNVLADFPGWERELTRWLSKAGDVIDVVGVDHYPGTWSWRPVTEWAPLRTILRRSGQKGDPLYGKRVAVVETGCSAWPERIVGDAGQVRWVRRALPALKALVVDANARDPGRVALLGFYQLMDAKGRVGQEGSFGVLRADGSLKPAAEALREELSRFP